MGAARILSASRQLCPCAQAALRKGIERPLRILQLVIQALDEPGCKAHGCLWVWIVENDGDLQFTLQFPHESFITKEKLQAAHWSAVRTCGMAIFMSFP